MIDRETLLTGAISCFNEKGIKFTMNELARSLGISKKTIYTVFRSKDELALALVDHLFDGIKDEEARVMADDSLDTPEKLRRLMSVMPAGYGEIDFRQLYLLRDTFPEIYAQVEERLENGWDNTIALLNQGMEEGVFRKVDIPLFKMMFEAALEQFFQRDVLVANSIEYSTALNEVTEILVHGITA